MKYIMHIYKFLAKNFLKYNRLRCFNFEICSILLPHDVEGVVPSLNLLIYRSYEQKTFHCVDQDH